MDWSHFIFYGAAAAICWIAGAVAAYRSEGVRPAAALSLCGSAIFLVFITGLWISLERPPMRTVGETRLWYSFFVSIAGIAVFARWRYRWILLFSSVMSIVFVCINVLKPEIHDKTLMPALRSSRMSRSI